MFKDACLADNNTVEKRKRVVTAKVHGVVFHHRSGWSPMEEGPCKGMRPAVSRVGSWERLCLGKGSNAEKIFGETPCKAIRCSGCFRPSWEIWYPGPAAAG